MFVSATIFGIPSSAIAEDELANFANGEFNPDLVNTECFATSCKLSTKACVEDGDCNGLGAPGHGDSCPE